MLYIIRPVRATCRAHLIFLDILSLYALKRTYFLSTQTAFIKKTAYETSSNLYNEAYKKGQGLRCEVHE